MCPRSRLATLAGDTLQCSLNLRQLLIDRHQVVSLPGGPKAPLQERVERLTTSALLRINTVLHAPRTGIGPVLRTSMCGAATAKGKSRGADDPRRRRVRPTTRPVMWLTALQANGDENGLTPFEQRPIPKGSRAGMRLSPARCSGDSVRVSYRKAVEVCMHSHERWSVLLPYIFVIPAMILSAAWTQDRTTSSAYTTVEGAKIFQYRCAICHGVDGKGHGPDSVVLRHPTPDLTLISRRTGGTFPYDRVKDIIDGENAGLLSQGDREMPIWGPIFHAVESDQDWGEVRLDAITRHVESIQQK